MGSTYVPTTRPGHRLPHAWVQRDGPEISTQDLVGRGAFVLITDGSGRSAWSAAAAAVAAKFDVRIEAVSVGADADVLDPRGDWAAVREFSEGGAILVRPDNHVAFRSTGAPADAEADLVAAMSTVLGR